MRKVRKTLSTVTCIAITLAPSLVFAETGNNEELDYVNEYEESQIYLESFSEYVDKELMDDTNQESEVAISITRLSDGDGYEAKAVETALAKASVAYWRGDYVVVEYKVSASIRSMLHSSSTVRLYDKKGKKLSETAIVASAPNPTDTLTGRATLYVGNVNAVRIKLSNGYVKTDTGVYPLVTFTSGLTYRWWKKIY